MKDIELKYNIEDKIDKNMVITILPNGKVYSAIIPEGGNDYEFHHSDGLDKIEDELIKNSEIFDERIKTQPCDLGGFDHSCILAENGYLVLIISSVENLVFAPSKMTEEQLNIWNNFLSKENLLDIFTGCVIKEDGGFYNLKNDKGECGEFSKEEIDFLLNEFYIKNEQRSHKK